MFFFLGYTIALLALLHTLTLCVIVKRKKAAPPPAAATPPRKAKPEEVLVSSAFQSRLEDLASEAMASRFGSRSTPTKESKSASEELRMTVEDENLAERFSRVGRTISLAAESSLQRLSVSLVGDNEPSTPSQPRGVSTVRTPTPSRESLGGVSRLFGAVPTEEYVSPHELEELAAIDSPDNAHRWMALEGDVWSVRGANYLVDRKKVPSATGSQLLAVEVFSSPTAITNAAGRKGAPPMRSLAARCTTPLETVFVLNLMLPFAGASRHVVLYFGVYQPANASDPAAVARRRFFDGDDVYRDKTFKLVSRVAEGPFMVRMAMPVKPAITGKTVEQHYTRDDKAGYFECALDVTKDRTAARVLQIVAPASRSLVIDVCVIIEGTRTDELPEMVIGSARLSRIDLSDASAKPL